MVLVISQDQWSLFARKHVSQERKRGIWPKIESTRDLTPVNATTKSVSKADIITKTHLYWHVSASFFLSFFAELNLVLYTFSSNIRTKPNAKPPEWKFL